MWDNWKYTWYKSSYWKDAKKFFTLLFDQKLEFLDADIHKDNLYDAFFLIQDDERIESH